MVAIIQELGVNKVSCIGDNMIVERESILRNCIMGVIYLLESLLTHTQQIEFPGFLVGSTAMELKLPMQGKYEGDQREAGKPLSFKVGASLPLVHVWLHHLSGTKIVWEKRLCG